MSGIVIVTVSGGPEECSNCGSTQLSWSIDTRTLPYAPGHNRLGLHDVEAILVLGCDKCSETLLVEDPDQVAVIREEG